MCRRTSRRLRSESRMQGSPSRAASRTRGRNAGLPRSACRTVRRSLMPPQADGPDAGPVRKRNGGLRRVEAGLGWARLRPFAPRSDARSPPPEGRASMCLAAVVAVCCGSILGPPPPVAEATEQDEDDQQKQQENKHSQPPFAKAGRSSRMRVSVRPTIPAPGVAATWRRRSPKGPPGVVRSFANPLLEAFRTLASHPTTAPVTRLRGRRTSRDSSAHAFRRCCGRVPAHAHRAIDRTVRRP